MHRLWMIGLLACFVAGQANALELTGSVSGEFRYFPESGFQPSQDDTNFSLSVLPEVNHTWDSGRQTAVFEPFFRLDQRDEERTHFDIRELMWTKAWEEWELKAGIGKVFWGVTESQHLVDFINQTDLVENPDTEDKLGQPMVNLGWIQSWGTLELFVLPFFRERTFPGADGRLRFPLLVDRSLTVYESDLNEFNIDGALRWSHALGDFDIGLAHFFGSDREPRFSVGVNSVGDAVLVPTYNLVHRSSLDLQWTYNSWLWKLEAIHLVPQNRGPRFLATVFGFEYTFYGILGTKMDLGVLSEFHYDERGSRATNPFEEDLFGGFRLVLNDVGDTQLLAGSIFDLDTQGKFIFAEFSRRVFNQFVVSIEYRGFMDIPANELFAALSQDDFLQFEVSWYF